MKPDRAVKMLIAEYGKAVRIHKPFHSAHEGFAVILEEMDELKAEVWKKQTERDQSAMRTEAIQVGAMVLRFLTDCCEAREDADDGDM